MRVMQHPWAKGLFCAIDVAQSGQETLSATGLHETICGARLRCRMEMLERLHPFASPPLSPNTAVGYAASPDRQMSSDHAALEAQERLLGTLWWRGQIAASPAPRDAIHAIERCRDTWQITFSDSMIARALRADRAPPTMIVILSETGYDICIGLAARPTWALAGEAALSEALQLRFGLHVIRHRLQHGEELSARGLGILHRAGGLSITDLAQRLDTRDAASETPRCWKTQQHRCVTEKAGIWYAQSTVTLTAPLGPAQTGPWSRWSLMP